MTLREQKSKRKARAIRVMVENGEYSPAYASMEAEKLNDEQKILDVDYIPLAEWLDTLLTPEETEPIVEDEGEPGVPVED